MKIDQGQLEEEAPSFKQSFKKIFYVNRNNFKVEQINDSDTAAKRVWGNVITKITSTEDKETTLITPSQAGESSKAEEVKEEEVPVESTFGRIFKKFSFRGETAVEAEPVSEMSSSSIKEEEGGEAAEGSNEGEKKPQSSSRVTDAIRKVPLGGSLLRKLGVAKDEPFELPDEYKDGDDTDSEFDPEAIYILPVIGLEHIFEKQKTLVLRRNLFGAKQVKSTFNIVDRRNHFHFRAEAELYDLKRERVLTDKTGSPTMGLRYDFKNSSWHILAGENLKERRAIIMVNKSLFGNQCNVYVHLPPYPLEFEAPDLVGVNPLLKVKGGSIEDGFEVWDIHEDKRQARIKKDLEYLTHWSFGTDSYYVEVQPFVDTGLMVAIGIIMEEETTTERERPYITGNLFKDVMLQVADNVYR